MKVFAVKQLHYGPTFKTIRSGFPRASAALAWLIDDARTLGRQVEYAWDAEHPGCADVLVFGDRYAEQYAIEPVR